MGFYQDNLQELHADALRLLDGFKEIHEVHGPLGLIQLIHDSSQDAINRSGLMDNATCTGSCSFCCHSKIMMPPLEAEYTRHLIELNGIKGNEHRIKMQNSDEPLKWIDQACPYLMEENNKGQRLCSIYEIRPMVCRTHNSQEDPKFCNKEEYPERTIQEGRIVQIEAVTLALVMLSNELENTQGNNMIGIHELKF